jgi:hypothetical protein
MGVLLDLAERGDTAVLTTTSGRRYRAVVKGVSPALVVLRAGDTTVLVAPDALTSIRPAPDTPPEPARRPAPADDRAVGGGATLSGVLADTVESQPLVTLLVSGDPDPLRGTLLWVGTDVVAIRPESPRGPDGAVVHVALQRVSEVLFTGSG